MKKAKKLLCLILAIVMLVGILPTFAITVSATELDLFRTAAYTAADGNIARGVVPTCRYTNGAARNTITNGVLNSNPVHNTWGIGSGAANDAGSWVLTWSQPMTITAMRVMWDVFTDTGVRWPISASVRYNPGATIPAGDSAITDTFGSGWIQAGTPVSPIHALTAGNVGVDGNSGGGANRPWAAPSPKANNTRWNVVVFDPPMGNCVKQHRSYVHWVNQRD